MFCMKNWKNIRLLNRSFVKILHVAGQFCKNFPHKIPDFTMLCRKYSKHATYKMFMWARLRRISFQRDSDYHKSQDDNEINFMF